MKSLRKSPKILKKQPRQARMELPTYLPDFEALSKLASLADCYAAEIARGPLQRNGAQVRAPWSRPEAAGWHPSFLLADKRFKELRQGPGCAIAGGIPKANDPERVERFVKRHQAALVQGFEDALGSNPAFIELVEKAPEFHAGLKAFEDAKRNVRGRSSPSLGSDNHPGRRIDS